MIDLIVFSAGSNRYALNIENVQRIIQSQELTVIPNSHELIDGMMSYEDSVIKVLNFRKLIGLPSYNDELKKLFVKLKQSHQEWIDDLNSAVNSGTQFSKTTDPHKCELGAWLDSFNSYDDGVSLVLKALLEVHKQSYTLGADILELRESEPEAAKELLETKLKELSVKTLERIDDFTDKLDGISNSLQKLLLYENGGKSFAIKVDSIEDIAHIEESMIMNSDKDCETSDYLDLEGVLDLDGVLINIIKTISIPS